MDIDLEKAANDLEYFAKHILGIDTYSWQFPNNRTPKTWRERYKNENI